MLARSRTIQHPAGSSFRTPLLLPSFSSKGLGFTSSGKSALKEVFNIASDYLTDAMLVSAYDVYHGHLPKLRSAITGITFVDSGGYETSAFQDLSAVFAQPAGTKPWNETLLRDVYSAWPERIPAVFVAFDRNRPVRDQISAAHKLLRRHPQHLHAILLKPQTKRGARLAIGEIVGNAEALGHFHVIGVTEKELGSSMLERMEAIARLRLALDDAGLADRPIHVFGSLDPISVPLYFVAGAEIFDGLTWLRFGYHDGTAMYQQNCAARRVGVHHNDDQIRILNLQNNLVALSDLTQQMRRFVNDGDYAVLGPNGRIVNEAFESLRSRFGRVAA